MEVEASVVALFIDRALSPLSCLASNFLRPSAAGIILRRRRGWGC